MRNINHFLLLGLCMLMLGLYIWYKNIRTRSRWTEGRYESSENTNCNHFVLNVDLEKNCVPRLYSDECIAGHVKNFKPMCGQGGCLRHLPSNPKQRYYRELPRKHLPLLDNTSKVYSEWHSIPGWIHYNVHISLITHLTDMQWYNGIYGSVGEIGVYKGQMTSLLALNMDTTAGERLFVADIFENKTKLQTEIGRYDIFVRSLKKWGFSVNSTNPEKRLHIWWESSVYLRKEVLKRWNIPALRIISVDGGHSYPIVMNDFIKAVCLIRQGGIIIFDDFPADKAYKSVERAIKDFFVIFGSDAVVPLVLTGMKLYVCTKDHAATYRAYIRKHIAPKLGLVEETSSQITGNDQTYFVGKQKGKRVNRR